MGSYGISMDFSTPWFHHSTQEELVKLIGVLCRKFPEVRREVQGFSPTVPLEAMLKEIQRAAAMINKKLPWDKYGRGNGDAWWIWDLKIESECGEISGKKINKYIYIYEVIV